jgi:hypothetical protein
MKNSKITVLIDILLLTVSFVMLIFTIMSDRYYTIFKQTYFYALPNQKILPLANIEPVNFKCRKNYSPLFTYTYQGNYEGCYLKTLHLLKDLPCSDERLLPFKKGAVEIPELDRDGFHIWRNVSLCGKRYTEDTFNFTYAKSMESCPVNYTDCGYIDVFKDRLCVAGPECPITYLNITTDISMFDSDNYTAIPLTDNKYLVYSREPNLQSFIPIDFSISEDIPCILPDRISYSSRPFPLAKNKENMGCNYNYKGKRGDDRNYTNYLDKRFILLDSIFTTEIFEHNEANSLNLLPNTETWTRNTTSRMNLYYRTRIRVNTECVNNENRALFRMALDTIKIRQYILVLLNLANMLFLCIFISVLSMMLVNSIPSLILRFVKLTLSTAFITANIYIAWSLFAIDQVVIDRMETAITSRCMDETTIFAMDEIYGAKGFLDGWKTSNYLTLFSNIPYMLLITIQGVWYFVYLYKKLKEMRRKADPAMFTVEMLHKSDDTDKSNQSTESDMVENQANSVNKK